MVGSTELGNELSSFMRGREFFDQLADYLLLKKDSFLWIFFWGMELE
jgi:hypothetical protein